MKQKRPYPPKWADRFLEWYCRPDLLEEIQGDVYELFYKRLGNGKKGIAKSRFVWDVIRFFRWTNIKSLERSNSIIHSVMLKNYLKVGFRNLLRHRVPAMINIVGLAVAIACAMVFFMYVDWQTHVDEYHQDSERIFQVLSKLEQNGTLEDWGTSPVALGPTAQTGLAAVEGTVRMDYTGGVMKYQDKVFNEGMVYVDEDFLSFFSFPVLYGNERALKDKQGIVITDRLAEKYFGDKMPLGEAVEVIFDGTNKREFTVQAVIHVPHNTSFRFNILLPYSIRKEIKRKQDAGVWEEFTNATFIKLVDPSDQTTVINQFNEYLDEQNAANTEWPVMAFGLQPLTTLAENSFYIKRSISSGQAPAGYVALGIIIVFLLLLAAFNYLNISIASSGGRLKEIAVRKVTGSSKGDLVVQFLVENFLIVCMSIALAFFMAYYLLWPGFNMLVPFDIPFGFSSRIMATGIIIALGAFIVLVSGLYPSLYIASFSAVGIMKGKIRFGRKNRFSKILLGFQYLMAFIIIVLSVRFTENQLFFLDKDWGYNQDAVLVLPIADKGNFNAFKSSLTERAGIISVAGSEQHLGKSWAFENIDIDGSKKEVVSFKVGREYPDLMGLELKSGRLFHHEENSDFNAIVINEKFTEMTGWDQPIGKSIKQDSLTYFVVGVVEDFHYTGFYEKVMPLYFSLTRPEKYNYLSVRVEKGNIAETERFIRDQWAELEPDQPNNLFYQDSVLDGFFEGMAKDVNLMIFIAIVTLMLSAMGLYGLVSFTITRRLKEFSIKKVLGASVFSIFGNLNTAFKWIILITFIIGVPVSYLMTSALIDEVFPISKPISLLPFVIGGGIIIVVSLLAELIQLGRVTRVNPSEILKGE